MLCIAKRGAHRLCGIFLAVFIVLALSPPASAQGFGPPPEPVEDRGPLRLEAWVGYEFTTPITTTSGTINIDASPTFGAAVAFAIDPGFQVELLWTIANTHSQLVSSTAGGTSTIPNHLDINYFQAGITKSIRCGDFECFGEATVGAVLLVPGAVRLTTGEQLFVQDTWHAAFTLAAGVRFFVVQQLAFVIEGRLLAPFYLTGGAFYTGSGGTVFVVSAGVPSIQGAFSAGLVLAL